VWRRVTMQGNVLLAVLTLATAVLLLVPALLAGRPHKPEHKDNARHRAHHA
jgi:hypothetical protein